LIFDYPDQRKERRHGPSGYASYERSPKSMMPIFIVKSSDSPTTFPIWAD
jgi:hypothetical protein